MPDSYELITDFNGLKVGEDYLSWEYPRIGHLKQLTCTHIGPRMIVFQEKGTSTEWHVYDWTWWGHLARLAPDRGCSCSSRDLFNFGCKCKSVNKTIREAR